MEKAEALVYIYTNSCLLCQRPSANLVHYYDDNIFLKDSNDDVEHSQKRMTITMITMMTKMVMEWKATMAVVEILLVEDENIAERTF